MQTVDQTDNHPPAPEPAHVPIDLYIGMLAMHPWRPADGSKRTFEEQAAYARSWDLLTAAMTTQTHRSLRNVWSAYKAPNSNMSLERLIELCRYIIQHADPADLGDAR